MGILSKLPIILAAFLIVLAIASFSYFQNVRRAQLVGHNLGKTGERLHSLPMYHGWFNFIWSFLPATILLLIASILKGDIRNSIIAGKYSDVLSGLDNAGQALLLLDAQKLAYGQVPSQTSAEIANIAASISHYDGLFNLIIGVVVIGVALLGYFLAKSKFHQDFRARNSVEQIAKIIMMAASGIAILTTFGIVMSLLFETFKFFKSYSAIDFLFGTQWSPQVAIRADQVGQTGSFGAVPLFLGTFMIMLIAMVVAVPVGLGSAIFLSEYASEKSRTYIKPALELLAGIPTVVYGFFALLIVAPFIRDLGESLGLATSSQSALAAGLVMGIMIIPFISSLSDDVINSVPQALRDGSYAMGATKSETIRKVILPAALPGIVGSVLLAVSRALGETMIVNMAAGMNANMSLNPLDMMTTVTVQIVTLLTGDQEYDSPKTHAAFALGFVLFFVTLILNIIALRVVQKYREKYD